MAVALKGRGDHSGGAMRQAPHRAEAGFSLIEALVAAFLLVLIVLALVPLFSAAMRNTLTGRELSVASQHSRSRVEQYMPLPLDRTELTIPAGDGELAVTESIALGAERWTTGAPTGPVPWQRTTVVRQYNVRDLYEHGRLTDRQPGGTAPGHVHLREVFVDVEVEREAGPVGPGQRVVLSTVRGF